MADRPHGVVSQCPRIALSIIGALVATATACGGGGGGTTGDDDDQHDDAGNPIIVDGAVAPADATVEDQPDARNPGPPYDDFPADPVVMPGVPANAAELFGADGPPTGGPCIYDPQPGTLYPRQWLRARVAYEPAGTDNLFEIRFHSEAQANDLVIYTADPEWTFPQSLWTRLNASRLVDQPISVSVRGSHFNGVDLDYPPRGSSPSVFRIAPVVADGTIVYWTAGVTGRGASFKGFKIGQEDVDDVLLPAQAGVGCVGCHSSTPDGKFVAFSANVALEDGRPARSDMRSLDGNFTQPPFLTTAARTLLSRTFQHQPVFTKAHWSDGDHIALTQFEVGGKTEIIWTDLEATSEAQGTGWGVIARTGNTGHSAGVAWSHDGTTLAYTASVFVSSGMNLDRGGGDIYTVPFADGAGGTATALAGASEASYSEHYPAWSADDALIAFTRVSPLVGSYDNRESEVFVVPATGGAATRLIANAPALCSGDVSPGIGNSWPKWSPKVESSGNKQYYWLTFSSRRGGIGLPQLYVTAITVENGVMTTYPALYLWNQPAGESNHTPAWDDFDIVID